MEINPTLLRDYDIRGRIDRPDELNDRTIEAITKAFAVFLNRRGISEAVVGHDARPYSKTVAEKVIQGLCASGMNVTEIGQVLVPIFYFSQYHLGQKGGVMVTASHNPWGWSGFKHAYDYSTTFVPENMAELRDIMREGKFLSGRGERKSFPDIIEPYRRDILSRVKMGRTLRVLVDAGNGTAGPIVPPILRKAGCEVFEQYTEVSESRHHEANPSHLGMLEAMRQGVKTHGVDIALGFDDDGDRLGAIDETGEVVWPDRILALLARPLLARHPGACIVFDVKCSQSLLDDISAHGGIPVMSRTGHSFIKAKSKETNALLAGERSGHIFFRQGYYGFDDAVFAALKFLEFLSRESRPLSEIVRELPHYITSPVWHAPCAEDTKHRVVEKLVQSFKEEFGEKRVIDVDGARVLLDEGWGLVRVSSNLPALVLVFESKTSEGLKKVEKLFRGKLARFSEVGKEWTSG
jgi:phosphomannomutase/phosphoglucomutase